VGDERQGSGLVSSLPVPTGAASPSAARACCESCVDERWLRSARYARWLAWASLVWMTAEGTIGVVAGITAGSIA